MTLEKVEIWGQAQHLSVCPSARVIPVRLRQSTQSDWLESNAGWSPSSRVRCTVLWSCLGPGAAPYATVAETVSEEAAYFITTGKGPGS